MLDEITSAATFRAQINGYLRAPISDDEVLAKARHASKPPSSSSGCEIQDGEAAPAYRKSADAVMLRPTTAAGREEVPDDSTDRVTRLGAAVCRRLRLLLPNLAWSRILAAG
jgi:hypothetical protein